jgi:hypothetical protein
MNATAFSRNGSDVENNFYGIEIEVQGFDSALSMA